MSGDVLGPPKTPRVNPPQWDILDTVSADLRYSAFAPSAYRAPQVASAW